MVSKASEDLPDPESPVITTSLSRGISTSMFFRLCSRAPRTLIWSPGMQLNSFGYKVQALIVYRSTGERAGQMKAFSFSFVFRFALCEGKNETQTQWKVRCRFDI